MFVSNTLGIWVFENNPNIVVVLVVYWYVFRTEQNRTEQNRTEQSRAEQYRTEQNRTEQNRTETLLTCTTCVHRYTTNNKQQTNTRSHYIH